MKNFNEYLDEMAVSSGINDYSNHSREATWNLYYKDHNFKQLLKDLGGEDHLRFYIVGKSSYYLTDDKDEYKGNIETRLYKNDVIIIKSSNSKLKRGFYNIMFSCLFAIGFKEILSDTDLSEQAISSYEKLNINGRLQITIYDSENDVYLPFSKKVLLSNEKYRISVKEKNKGSIKEHFNEYYNRISLTEIYNGQEYPSNYKLMFINREKGLNNYLFGEDYTITEEEYQKLKESYEKNV